MKKLTLVLLVMGIVFSMFAETVKITNGNWPPFLSQDLPKYGTVSHIITLAFKEVGINIEYGFFPWKRSFKLAKDGSWDGTCVWGKQEEREKAFYYSKVPVMTQKTVLFHLKSKSINWDKTINSLKPYKIGTTAGYSYGDNIAKAGNSKVLKIETTSKDILNMKKLLKGRTDIFLCNFDVGYEIISKNFSKSDQLKFTNHEIPLRSTDYFLLISKQSPRGEYWIKKFDEGFAKLKAKGLVEKILEGNR